MARPERHDVDYFPFSVKDGRTFFILENKYQCKGIGFFANLCRFLSQAPDHHYSIKDEVDSMYFFSKVKCDEESGIDMLNIMAKTGKIDKELWEDHRVIVSEDFLNSVKDAYKNRKNKIITIREICKKYGVNRITSDENPQESVVSSDENPQTKLKETKLKETISILERNLIFEIFYFKNFKYTSYEVDRFINNYSSTGWRNANGVEIKDRHSVAKNWKPESNEKLAPEVLLKKWQDAYEIIRQHFWKEDSNNIQYFLFLNFVPHSISGNIVHFSAPLKIVEIIEKRYISIYKKAIISVFGPGTKVEYFPIDINMNNFLPKK